MKKLFCTIGILFFASLLLMFMTQTVKAENLSMPTGITQWKIDNDKGLIYAVSQKSGMLYFISTKDLKIEKEMSIGNSPTDIEFCNGKLYIPLSEDKKIVIVDAETKSVVKSLTTQSSPYRIAVDQNKLFYAEEDQQSETYVYDMTNKSEQVIDNLSNNPALAIDRNNHILYIGESGLTGSNIKAFSTSDYKQISRSTYDNGYGFYCPSRTVYFDGTDAYYAGCRLNGSDLGKIEGNYHSNVLFVNGNYVFTQTGVYDRDKYVKIKDLPINASLALMDDQNNIYLLSSDNSSINKITMDLTLNTKTNAQTVGNKLILDEKITKWVYDKTRNNIYAISQKSNKLLYINAGDMTVEGEKYIGSDPSDIDLCDGNIYVALFGSNKIAITGVALNSDITIKYIKSNPYRIAVDQNKLFYTEKDQWCNTYVCDMPNGSEQVIDYSSDPALAIDRNNHILYIGESGSTGSNIKALNTLDYKQISKSTYDNGCGFYFPSRVVYCDGTAAYYAGFRLNASDLGKIEGNYHGNVLFVKDNYVFTQTGVYDRDKYVKIKDLPINASLALMDDQNNIYLLSSDDGSISKITMDLTLNTKTNDQTVGNKIILDKRITKWVYDKSRNYIYAISQESNKLLYINAGDMTVEGEKYIGSDPSDIDLYDGSIYVALPGSNKIAITGVAFNSDISIKYVKSRPYRIAVDQNKMFYAEQNGLSETYVYDITSGSEQIIGDFNWNLALDIALAIDRDNHILYIGESGSTWSDIKAFSTSDYKQLSNGNYGTAYGLPNYYMSVIFDDGNLYYAGNKFCNGDLSKSVGSYGENIVYAKGRYIFGTNSVFDKESYNKLYTLPSDVMFEMVDSAGGEYFYNDKAKTISKYDSVSPVAGDITVSGLQSITIPSSGTSHQYNYTVSLKDQYGSIMGNQTITWSLNEPVNGLSIDKNTGILTITDQVTVGSVTVKASSFNATGVINIKLVKAISIPTKINTPVNEILELPNNVPASYELRAIVCDQYNKPMNNISVEWYTYSNLPTGVTLNDNVLTINNQVAIGTKFTLKASYGSILITKNITLGHPVKYGDMDGDGKVTANDLNKLKDYIALKKGQLDLATGNVALDVNGDGKINSLDYSLIKRFELGKINIFPVQMTNITHK